MRILYGYPAKEGYNNRTGLTNSRLRRINRLKDAGFDVKPFCLNVTSDLAVLSFSQLDKLWKFRDRHLLQLYDRFLKEMEDRDVFYNSVGINFHPEFLESISKITIFGFNDDPESSERLSSPVAKYYDMCAIGNIAEIDTYKSWGVKNVFWQPMGFSPEFYNPDLTYNQILESNRSLDLFMMIDKLSRYRREKMDKIDKAFPTGFFYGRGWKRGYLPQGKEVEFLQKTKIGLNIHNSTGPINTRLYYLPANGVMQICDNKNYLAKVFKLGKEVVGFDNIDECIELCHYYRKHEEERRVIAANGWKRAMNEYNEISVFNKLIENIKFHSKYLTPRKEAVLNKGKENPLSVVYRNYIVSFKDFKRFGSRLYRKIVK